jgi:hypothetical protein
MWENYVLLTLNCISHAELQFSAMYVLLNILLNFARLRFCTYFFLAVKIQIFNNLSSHPCPVPPIGNVPALMQLHVRAVLPTYSPHFRF